jgi:hypothetical protein
MIDILLLLASWLVAFLLIRGMSGHEQRLNDRLVPYSNAVAAVTASAKGSPTTSAASS